MQDKGLDLSKSPKEIAKDLIRLDEAAKAIYVGEWAENLAHASGFLLDATRKAIGALVGTALKLYVEKDRYGGPSPVDILRPTLSRYLGRHLSLMGGWQVIGRSGGVEDKDQAEAAERVLSDKWENADLDVTCQQAFLLAQATSHGFVKIEGDDKLSPAPEQLNFPDGPREQVSGDVVYSILTAFQVCVLPGIERFSDSPAVLIKEFMSQHEYERRWGSLPERTQPKPAKFERGQLDTIVAGLEKSMIEVQRLFIKQCKEFPNGAQFVIVGEGEPLAIKNDAGENWMGTYNAGTPERPKYEYPIVDFADEPVHMGYWGRGRQSAARPIIKALCTAWSRLAHIASLPLVLALPEGSDVAPDEMANVPFLPITYNPAVGPPTFLTPPTIESLHKLIDRCLFWIAEIYSQHEASRGVPSGSRFPAEAVKLLQEQDLLADSPAGKMALKAMQRVGQKILGEGLRVWGDDYVATVLGPNNVYKRYVLRKGSLQPGVDVRVIPGNERPKAKDAMAKEITEVARYGLIQPKEARRLLGVSTREDMRDLDEAERQVIKWEEAQFEQGKPVEISWSDTNEMHVDEHRRDDIERRYTATPEEKQARSQHVKQHMDAMRIEAEAAAAAIQPPAIPGGPEPQPVDDQGVAE